MNSLLLKRKMSVLTFINSFRRHFDAVGPKNCSICSGDAILWVAEFRLSPRYCFSYLHFNLISLKKQTVSCFWI